MAHITLGRAPYAGALVDPDDRVTMLRLRMRGEFAEMPGLCLFAEQAARLFGLDRSEAENLLESLEEEGYLRRTALGFVRGGGSR